MPTTAFSSLSGIDTGRHEQRKHVGRHEQHQHQRHAAHDFNEDGREQADDWHVRIDGQAPA